MSRGWKLIVCLLGLLPIACQQSATNPSAAAAAKSSAGKPAETRPVGEHAHPAFNSVPEMMKAKLAHAQAVLEGIVIDDLASVELNAKQLIRLSELAAWQVHRTMEYNMYSDEFRFNARELARHAKERKLHAAVLDYLSITTSCVKCHDYMKQAGLVREDVPAGVLGMAP
jgi:hypothetical protein